MTHAGIILLPSLPRRAWIHQQNCRCAAYLKDLQRKKVICKDCHHDHPFCPILSSVPWKSLLMFSTQTKKPLFINYRVRRLLEKENKGALGTNELMWYLLGKSFRRFNKWLSLSWSHFQLDHNLTLTNLNHRTIIETGITCKKIPL